jgi:hypothetical protein
MLTGFEAQASGAVLDLTGDDDQAMRSKKNCVKWDVKKRKYVKSDQVRNVSPLHPDTTRLRTGSLKLFRFCGPNFSYIFLVHSEIQLFRKTINMEKRDLFCISISRARLAKRSKPRAVSGFQLRTRATVMQSGGRGASWCRCRRKIRTETKATQERVSKTYHLIFSFFLSSVIKTM